MRIFRVCFALLAGVVGSSCAIGGSSGTVQPGDYPPRLSYDGDCGGGGWKPVEATDLNGDIICQRGSRVVLGSFARPAEERFLTCPPGFMVDTEMKLAHSGVVLPCIRATETGAIQACALTVHGGGCAEHQIVTLPPLVQSGHLAKAALCPEGNGLCYCGSGPALDAVHGKIPISPRCCPNYNPAAPRCGF